MLIKIREKSQGLFAWVILLLICVPFALWGIQNYVGGGSESSIASVGGTDFFQQDLNRAYAQYSQNMAGMDFDEADVKRQALQKLIQDEVLLQHVEDEGLVVTNQQAKKFISSLEYFQVDGKFDNNQYKALLAAQRISSTEFVNRIKKAMVMEQFQRSILESSFATSMDIEDFFRIQNQKRTLELVSIPLQTVEQQPSEEAMKSYFQQNQNNYMTKEQVSIEYVELTLDALAKQISATNEQLVNYYEDNSDQFTTNERRKISHILFAFTDKDEDDKQLQRAIAAKNELANKDFSVLANEVSDDKLTATKGGDLGLFNAGDMEKSLEDAVNVLKLGEVSEPVKSQFGYHLIKVTELVTKETKPFEQVKDQITVAYQRAEAEEKFYELSQELTDVSFENPDSLLPVADTVDLKINKTALFTRDENKAESVLDDFLKQPVIINAAFSEDVLKGINSEPIELGSERLVVLRMLEYHPAQTKPFDEVKLLIQESILNQQSREITKAKADDIKTKVIAGQSIQELATDNNLEIQKFTDITRANGDLNWQLNQAVFKAAKPTSDQSTVIVVAEPSGTQTVINLVAVAEGVMSESDKAKYKLAETNMQKAFGQADFNVTLNNLRENTDIKINIQE